MKTANGVKRKLLWGLAYLACGSIRRAFAAIASRYAALHVLSRFASLAQYALTRCSWLSKGHSGSVSVCIYAKYLIRIIAC
jgi:hypothetical protein